MKSALPLLLVTVLVGVNGCSSLFHPRAGEFFNQAKGATGVQTGLALIAMMETSIQRAMNETGEAGGLADLHDQFHALHGAFCQMTEAQASTTAYAYSVTVRKEMRIIFHRLWEYRDDPILRNLHLGLFAARLHELKMALKGIES